jgi:hypothetical protein
MWRAFGSNNSLDFTGSFLYLSMISANSAWKKNWTGTQGATVAEALANIKDAIGEWLGAEFKRLV